MDKKEMQNKVLKLIQQDSLDDSLEILDIFLEFMFIVIEKHHNDPITSNANKDAVMLHQMMFTKLTHLRKLIEGVGYVGKNDIKMNPIIDPIIIASLVRNIYETVSVFNLIYRYSKTPDEKQIIYGLWVCSGLEYRQRFESFVTGSSNLKTLDSEMKTINRIKSEIRKKELYQNLDERNKGKIETALKKKEFKIKFEGDKVVNLNWQDMTGIMGLNKGLFEHIYTYFSLYAHPSQVSVFQFENMFSKENEEFKRLTNFNLRYCFSLASVFIADYINLFPLVKSTFESLDVYKQIIINSSNRGLRGEEYSINNCWESLI